MTRTFRLAAVALLALAATLGTACSDAQATAPSGDFRKVELQQYLTKAMTVEGTLTTDKVRVAPAAFSAAPLVSTGAVVNVAAVTMTDSSTANSGTATQNAFVAFQRPTLASTGTSVTTTDAATVYIANSPAAGTNETITNAWSLWVDAGGSRFDGTVDLQSTTNATTCTLNGGSPSTCTATVFAGAVCTCSPVGATAAIAAAGCAVGLSGTTLTVTSANSATNVVNVHCF
jgi:hypothetical protein